MAKRDHSRKIIKPVNIPDREISFGEIMERLMKAPAAPKKPSKKPKK